jgi:DNA-binding FrmR family transcriptional regulator
MPDETLSFKTDLTHRLQCAEGHLGGIAAMVARGADCDSLIHQIMAVQGALREVNRLLLKHHLEVCLRERLQGSDIAAREQCLGEVVSLYNMFGVTTSLSQRKTYDCYDEIS